MRTKAEVWLNTLFNDRELYHEYDPVKAREYYLRTRELKGRQPGAEDPESVRRAQQASTEAAERDKQIEVERQKRREALKARLEELEVRLEKLKNAVKRARLAAMRRAGVSEETLNRMITQEVKSPGSTKGGKVDPSAEKAGGKSDSSDSSDDKPKSAQQKRKDAKAAKERYEEEQKQNPDPDEELAALQEKVDDANNRIEKMQKRVEAIQRIGSDEEPKK